jgi:hypothetical protein
MSSSVPISYCLSVAPDVDSLQFIPEKEDLVVSLLFLFLDLCIPFDFMLIIIYSAPAKEASASPGKTMSARTM